MIKWPAAGILVFLAELAARGQDAQEALRKSLADAVSGPWIYNDLDKAIAEGRKTGKPLLVVIR